MHGGKSIDMDMHNIKTKTKQNIEHISMIHFCKLAYASMYARNKRTVGER